jgi:predicted transcriptional regulator
MSELQNTPNYIQLAADIVSAFVSNNSVPITELPALIDSVHQALTRVASGSTQQPQEDLRPAVPIKKSVTSDYIVCLEDGKRFKSLKRHLRTSYNMTSDQYRAKWGLPASYPMVAPNYAASRSELAKRIGLGARGRKTPEPTPPAAPAKGRRKKAA